MKKIIVLFFLQIGINNGTKTFFFSILLPDGQMARVTWFAKFGHFGHHPRKRTKKKIFIDFRPIASDPGRLPIKETKSVFLRGPTPGRLEIFRFFQKFQKIHPRGSYGYERNPGNYAVETVLMETLLVETAPWKLSCGKCAVENMM